MARAQGEHAAGDDSPTVCDAVAAVQQHFNPGQDVVLRSEYIPEKQFKVVESCHTSHAAPVGSQMVARCRTLFREELQSPHALRRSAPNAGLPGLVLRMSCQGGHGSKQGPDARSRRAWRWA